MECHLWYLSDLSVKVNPDIKAPCTEEQQQEEEGRLSETCETKVPQDWSQHHKLYDLVTEESLDFSII